ncbi:MAG: DUF4905 domain-containing protein [Sphingobacteriales bacterium]|nr:DUF4905 domain-containing protein [Sphingobacteriales bacterium]
MSTNKDTLKLLYSTQSDGIIWKLQLDNYSEILIWEIRSFDKKVSFSAYDFKHQTELFNHFRFEEEWLIGLVGVKNGIAYFHGYESEFSPVQKGIIAFDLIQKKIIWQNFCISVQGIFKEGMVVFDSRVSPRKYQLLDFKTGSVIQKINIEELNHLKVDFPQIQIPEMISSPNIWETQHRLKAKDLDFIVSYEDQNQSKHQKLEVYKNHELLLSDYLNKEIKKLSFDTFLLWHDRLIYIRNKREIVSYLV